jgi:hypothetical protein
MYNQKVIAYFFGFETYSWKIVSLQKHKITAIHQAWHKTFILTCIFPRSSYSFSYTPAKNPQTIAHFKNCVTLYFLLVNNVRNSLLESRKT